MKLSVQFLNYLQLIGFVDADSNFYKPINEDINSFIVLLNNILLNMNKFDIRKLSERIVFSFMTQTNSLLLQNYKIATLVSKLDQNYINRQKNNFFNKIKLREISSKSFNFIPNTHRKSLSTMLNHSFRKENKEVISKSFIARQNYYTSKKQQNLNYKKIENEEENSILYTFIPEINNDYFHLCKSKYASKSLSAFKRLQYDSSRRIHNSKALNTELNKNNKNERTVNKQRIENLYKDFKRKQYNISILSMKLNFEQGITFQPKINK